MADYAIAKANVKTTVVDGKTPLITRLVCAEAIFAGQMVTVIANQAYLLDLVEPAYNSVAGMALNDAGAGQPVDIIIDGYVNVGAVGVAGDVAVASVTNGGLSSWADLVATNEVSVFGFFESDSIIKVSINNLGIAKG